MSDQSSSSPGAEFDRLVGIMARLRAPGGCPWDREQDFRSLKKYLLEEAYEVLHSIEVEDWANLREELGDLMLQPVFLAQIAAEQGLFTIADSLSAINQKLIRRHPHVFGDAAADTAEDVKQRWDEIKAEEKREQGREAQALLDGVPRALPALVEAQEIGAKVAKVGFDWPSVDEVTAKVHEELEEIRHARDAGSRDHIEEELGDLLFAVTNLARLLKIDAEQALRHANLKFRERFAFVEAELERAGRPLGTATLEEMEAKWQQAKQRRT
jgi:MazG family protein